MNFDLTEQQRLLRRTIHDFAEREIAPGAGERDESARFPDELVPKMAKLGLFGVMIPELYGGAGLDAMSFAIILEEVARAELDRLTGPDRDDLDLGAVFRFEFRKNRVEQAGVIGAGRRRERERLRRDGRC